MKKKPIPKIPADNIQDFLQLAVFIASERPSPNEFLRTEANTARVIATKWVPSGYLKFQGRWVKNLMAIIELQPP